ncbi:MAG: HlyC/CorC family transporter [Chlamydiia bacterium]|nr:HlyC/CorC family transporter [Chlamydiia bacterium]
MNSAFFWLMTNFVAIGFSAFYSVQEMACVSLNKFRLKYLVKQGNKRAEWLNWLLHNPSRLFGTTLIGVNVATFISSECARNFHTALGLSPDLAPLSQVLLVLIFGELAPIFAGRYYAEHMSLLGAPVIYFSARLLAPLIWILGGISRLANRLLGGKETSAELFLTQEELLKILEEQEEESQSESAALAQNLFKIKDLHAWELMAPLSSEQRFPSHATVADVRQQLKPHMQDIVIYSHEPNNIVGVVTIRNLLRAPETRRARDYSRAPWFVTLNSKAASIILQFRKNNEEVAIVLNKSGQATGILRIDNVMETLFGKTNLLPQPQEEERKIHIIDRTLPGDLTVHEFNTEFQASLPYRNGETLSDWLVHQFGHHPEADEMLYTAPFEFTIKEATLLTITSVRVRTRMK